MDSTPEALEGLMEENGGCIAIFSDEGGIFDIMAGRYSSQPNLDIFLKGHTGGRVSVNRRSRSSLIPRACLTMCISPQPSVIQGTRDKPFMRGRGLMARFLYAMPESPVGTRSHIDATVDRHLEDRYRSLITRQLQWNPGSPVRLRLSEPAYADWKDFQRHIETLMADGGALDRLRDWGSKLPDAALRIAGLFSGCRSCPPEQIEHDDVARATALCAALIPHAIAAFNLVDEDPKVALARRILRWLSKQKGNSVTRRDCFRALHRHFDQVKDMMRHCTSWLSTSTSAQKSSRQAGRLRILLRSIQSGGAINVDVA